MALADSNCDSRWELFVFPLARAVNRVHIANRISCVLYEKTAGQKL